MYRSLNVTSVRVNDNIWTVAVRMREFRQVFNSEKCAHFQRVRSAAADVDIRLVLKVFEVGVAVFSVFPYLPSQRHPTYFILSARFPPAYDSQRWVHAFAFMDTLQQS